MSRNNGKTKKEQSHKVFLSKEFVSDLTRQNMLYAKIVRSPQKNIRISTFNLSILPENYYFFTSRDIPGKNVLETLETKSKIFADGIISYKGEPIGILAGEDRQTVEYFAEKLSDSFIQPESDELQDSFKSEILAERNIKTGFFENQTEDSNEKTKDITKTEDDFISVSSEFEYEENFYPWNETSGAFCFYEEFNCNVAYKMALSFKTKFMQRFKSFRRKYNHQKNTDSKFKFKRNMENFFACNSNCACFF